MRRPARGSVGSRLRAILEHLDMKQVEFAAAVGCSQAFISQVHHDRSGPSTALMAYLERRGISGSWLLTGHGSMKSTTSTPSTPSPSDSSDSSAPSESLSVRDGPCSSQSPPTLTLILPPDVQAGDTILVQIDRRDHPLALIGKIIYTLPRK